jgi:hypothetical protein
MLVDAFSSLRMKLLMVWNHLELSEQQVFLPFGAGDFMGISSGSQVYFADILPGVLLEEGRIPVANGVHLQV